MAIRWSTPAGVTLSQAAGVLDDYEARVRMAADEQSRQRITRKAQRWQERGDRYMRGRNVPRDQSIRPPADLNQMMAAHIERAYPAVADAIQRYFLPVAWRAVERWPVDTGLSRSMLSLDFFASDSEYGVRLANRAPYVWYIGRARRQKGGHTVVRAVLDAGDSGQEKQRKIAAFFDHQKQADAGKRRARGHAVTVLVFRPGEAAAADMQAAIGAKLGDR
jgi:hypothetical protein